MYKYHRHNRELNHFSPSSHPSFLNFTVVIKNLSRSKPSSLDDTKKVKVRPLKHDNFEILDAPGSHKYFKPKK